MIIVKEFLFYYVKVLNLFKKVLLSRKHGSIMFMSGNLESRKTATGGISRTGWTNNFIPGGKICTMYMVSQECSHSVFNKGGQLMIYVSKKSIIL